MVQTSPTPKRKRGEVGQDEHPTKKRSSGSHHAPTAKMTAENPSMPQIKKENQEPVTEPRSRTEMSIKTSPSDDIIYFYIGPHEIRYVIHSGHLQRTPSTFSQIVKDSSIPDGHEDITLLSNDGSKAIILKAEDPIIFNRFYHWLYERKLTLHKEDPKSLSWSLLIDLYIFAESKRIPELQNACIDAIILYRKARGRFPAQDIITPLWQSTAEVEPCEN